MSNAEDRVPREHIGYSVQRSADKANFFDKPHCQNLVGKSLIFKALIF